MSTRLVTVRAEDDLAEALALMTDHSVRRLPVVRSVGGETVLVGIVSDRDLRLASDSPYLHDSVRDVVADLRRLSVADVMTRDVVTVFPTATVARAAALMIDRRVGGLPVIEQEEGRPFLVGIVTRTDLLGLIARHEGPPQPEAIEAPPDGAVPAAQETLEPAPG